MTHSQRHSLLAAFAYITLGLALLLVLLVGFWSFYPYKTIKQTPNIFPIVYPPPVSEGAIPVVPQGGVVSYKFAYTKYTDVYPTIHRRFVDGLVFNEGLAVPTVVEKGSGIAVIEVDIPRTLPPGTYRLEITTQYKMNPIRTITRVRATSKFKVVAAYDNDKDGK